MNTAEYASTKKYHVAGKGYSGGDLRPWNDLDPDQRGEWKWEDAPEGTDGNVVCLYDTLGEAEDHAREMGGRILAVDLGDLIEDKWIEGTDSYITTVGEGFTAVCGHIPAECITEVKEGIR